MLPPDPLLLCEESATVEMKQTYYIVQRCWFDGPNVAPPVDFLALFDTQTQAENCAYQSAHFYAQNQHAAVVRTLLLPTGNGSGFACSAAGKLFWVRRVIADISIGGEESAGAHCILRNGIVGGTGNTNSRRGSEAETNCVFVGADSHARAQLAVEQHGQHGTNTVSWLPIGCCSDMMQGWPDLQSLPNAGNAVVQDQPFLAKRQTLEDQHQYHYNPSAPRPAKRLCGDQPTPMAMETTDVDVHGPSSYS
jgi:hypothetical protein